MTHETHARIIVVGFTLSYIGVMGLLLTLSTDLPEGVLGVVRLALAVAAAVGAVLLPFAKLAPIREG